MRHALFSAPLTPRTAILAGAVIIGTLDLINAFTVWGLRGVAPVVILKSIASGLLGREAHAGGAGVAALGAVLHYFICLVMAAVYVVAAQRWALLKIRWVVGGIVYGLGTYVVMNHIVLPLSAFPGSIWTVGLFINALFAHTVLVGLPVAFLAHRT